jgi:predicted permease
VARRAFGNTTLIKEQTYEVWGWGPWERFLRDMRFAWRILLKSPVFAATAIFTLALGIGANTAIFSVMNAVRLRMLPVGDPDRLVYITHEHLPESVGVSGDHLFTNGINIYERLRQTDSAFSEVIAYVPLSTDKTAVRYENTAEEVRADEVSGNFLTALGVRMAAGQPFLLNDENKHSAIVVISYGYWTRRFNRNPDVIGKVIYVNGVACTVLGVTVPHFYGVESGGIATDLWIPLQNRPELPARGLPTSTGHSLYGSPNFWTLMLIARLKPGITPQQATAMMSPVYAHAAYETAGRPAPGALALTLQLVSARGLGTASSEYRGPLRILMGMVILVLIIACINIVMLVAARNATREREFSLRLSLGASGWTLFRQLFAESLILIAGGTCLGWLFALEATILLAKWSGLEIGLAPDIKVLAFTLTISGAATFLFGLAPLRVALRAPVASGLRSAGPHATQSRRHVLTGKALLTVQMAFCLTLLVAASLLVKTLDNFQDVDLGMQAERVLAFGVHPLGVAACAQRLEFYRHLMERLHMLPGVESVTLAEVRPGIGDSNNGAVMIDGHQYPWEWNKRTNNLRNNAVGPNFFKTLGIPVVAGRDILDSDTRDAPRIAVVNQTLVDRYFKGTGPLGHYLGTAKWHATIIGVVRDSKYESASEARMPMAWYSYQQSDSIGSMDVAVRTNGNTIMLLPEITDVVHEIDPEIPLNNPQVLSAQFAETYVMPALFARLAIFFGALAALLVGVGLYGTLAYRVSCRTAEIGIRLALGAPRIRVLWWALRESIYLAVVGLAIGLPLAMITSRWMASMLYQLSPYDPLSFAAASTGVLVVSILAALIPAKRAASIDPIQALRTE